MFERYRERKQRQRDSEAAATPTVAADTLTVYGLISQGFAGYQVESLIAARRRFLDGDLNEWPTDYSNFRFAKWLYEHGKIGS
jgi:hypothetical protein